MKHVKLYESWTAPVSIEDEVYELLKKVNAQDKNVVYALEPCESKNPKALRTFDEHREKDSHEIEQTVRYTNAKGEKREIDFVAKFAWTHYPGSGDPDPSVGKDPEDILEDIEVSSFFLSDDEGETIACEFTPAIHYEVCMMVATIAACTDFSRGFDKDMKALKAKI